jgi:hypothetical protein
MFAFYSDAALTPEGLVLAPRAVSAEVLSESRTGTAVVIAASSGPQLSWRSVHFAGVGDHGGGVRDRGPEQAGDADGRPCFLATSVRLGQTRLVPASLSRLKSWR